MYSQFYNIDLLNTNFYIPSGDKNDNVAMDPVRWWPSGVPQSAAIVGTAVATFAALSRIPGVSGRLRVLGALGSAGVSANTITYNSALENSLGFNRFMWGLTEYRKSGTWPSLEKVSQDVSDTTLDKFANDALKNADNILLKK